MVTVGKDPLHGPSEYESYTLSRKPEPAPCESFEVRCCSAEWKTCINEAWVDDGHDDCGDGSDEPLNSQWYQPSVGRIATGCNAGLLTLSVHSPRSASTSLVGSHNGTASSENNFSFSGGDACLANSGNQEGADVRQSGSVLFGCGDAALSTAAKASRIASTELARNLLAPIGSSTEDSKQFTIDADYANRYSRIECPTVVNNTNWQVPSPHSSAADVFAISMTGNTITATRVNTNDCLSEPTTSCTLNSGCSCRFGSTRLSHTATSSSGECYTCSNDGGGWGLDLEFSCIGIEVVPQAVTSACVHEMTVLSPLCCTTTTTTATSTTATSTTTTTYTGTTATDTTLTTTTATTTSTTATVTSHTTTTITTTTIECTALVKNVRFF